MAGRLDSSTHGAFFNNDVEWDSGELLAYLDGASVIQHQINTYNKQGWLNVGAGGVEKIVETRRVRPIETARCQSRAGIFQNKRASTTL